MRIFRCMRKRVLGILYGISLVSFIVTSVSFLLNAYMVSYNGVLSYNYVDTLADGTPDVREEDGRRYVTVHGEEEELTSSSYYLVPMEMSLGYLDGRLVVPVDSHWVVINILPVIVTGLLLYVLGVYRMRGVWWIVPGFLCGIVVIISMMWCVPVYDWAYYALPCGWVAVNLICAYVLLRHGRGVLRKVFFRRCVE